jgi:hypothetical protein
LQEVLRGKFLIENPRCWAVEFTGSDFSAMGGCGKGMERKLLPLGRVFAQSFALASCFSTSAQLLGLGFLRHFEAGQHPRLHVGR